MDHNSIGMEENNQCLQRAVTTSAYNIWKEQEMANKTCPTDSMNRDLAPIIYHTHYSQELEMKLE